MDLRDWEWTCACCGERKRGVPDLAFDAPLVWQARDRDPAIRAIGKDDDFCVVEIGGERHVWIRCVLPVPLTFAPGEFFGYGVWSTLSAANAERYRASFSDADQAKLGEMFGYLGNSLPGYPETENMHLTVAPRDGGQRPLVRVRDRHAGHPLWRDQRDGMDAERLGALLSGIMPCGGRA